jgi:hypothetical protein
MRLRFMLAALLGAVLASASVALGADRDQGISRPPGAIAPKYKALWMGEWVACSHKSLRGLAQELHLKVPAGRKVQVTATMVAKVAEAPLWNLQQELDVAVNGCRNGILWRFYHQ